MLEKVAESERLEILLPRHGMMALRMVGDVREGWAYSSQALFPS
jgi:hypothetical protein